MPATPPDRVETWREDTLLLRAEVWADLRRADADADSPTFAVLAIHDPRHRAPLLLTTPLALPARAIRDCYVDRWPIEQLPLAAKQMLGGARQFVHAPETCQRLPALTLLAGAVLSYTAAPAPARPAPPPPGHTSAHDRAAFWRLTAAFGAATLACQVVVLHVADALAQADRPALAGRADQTVAAFYGGVALGAAVCAGVRPTLEREEGAQRGVTLHAAGRAVRVGVAPLVALAGLPTLLGVCGLASAVGRDTAWTWPIGAAPSFAAIGVGAGVFEVVVLATLASVRRAGDGLVALAFGIAATTAALGLFLMLLGGVHLPGWAAIIVGGLSLAAWLLGDGGRAAT